MKILFLVLILSLVLPTEVKSNELFKSFISSSINLITAEESIPSNTIKGRVVKVVDGDTVDIKIDNTTQRVRLLLVDTPETSHPILKTQPYGKEAKEFTKSILKENTYVYLEKDIDEKDKYGRLLGYLWYKDEQNEFKMINEELIRQGYARYAYAYNDYKYISKFKKIEKEARDNKVNIWSNEDYVGIHGFNS